MEGVSFALCYLNIIIGIMLPANLLVFQSSSRRYEPQITHLHGYGTTRFGLGCKDSVLSCEQYCSRPLVGDLFRTIALYALLLQRFVSSDLDRSPQPKRLQFHAWPISSLNLPMVWFLFRKGMPIQVLLHRALECLFRKGA